jgi:glycosyltransferase involved in cell wall biosynthesis
MISVVIAAWNAAATIGETLASIAAQTRPAQEVIVVDDGSDDATATIARAAGARVIRQLRQHQAAALNHGIAAGLGSLIAFLDADDLWPADKLQMQAAVLAGDPALDGVFGHCRCFADAGLDGTLRVPEGAHPGWLAGALLIRRSSLAAVGAFDPALKGAAFIDWMDRARRQGLRFAMPDQTVLLRRIRNGSQGTASAARNAAYVRLARAAIARRRAAEPSAP